MDCHIDRDDVEAKIVNFFSLVEHGSECSGYMVLLLKVVVDSKSAILLLCETSC